MPGAPFKKHRKSQESDVSYLAHRDLSRDTRKARCHQRALMVARAGIEPATFRFSGGRSYQLSYLAGRHVHG